ncbi:substrate-binding domain-containing protein [Halonatronum saccharophilum]|uniref:substrate-binding domain-containing protein n=1 Tax=Halonatronum saccharophilum TaxID=150060 RepID=UPI0005555CB7|nr:substrate-binding domain-containing protein [Halonatronum saccharophilum]
MYIIIGIIILLLIGGIKDRYIGSNERLILATTTSTDNSALLDKLIPIFEEKEGIRVDVVAVGTGKALELGRSGDSDLLLVHDEKSELEFIEQGYGIDRYKVMYNDFIVLGPKGDPSHLKGATSVVEAFKMINKGQSLFISRGDYSGTHKQELFLWDIAGVKPEGNWYQEVGQGMGSTLMVANEKEAYILIDRSTYLAYRADIDLEIVFEGDSLLYNLYGIMAVNPNRHDNINYKGATKFIKFIVSQKGQEIIRDHKIFGERLFNPLNL